MKSSFLSTTSLFVFTLFTFVLKGQTSKTILQTNEYQWRTDGVTQGSFSAVAVSPNEITSNYQSRQNTLAPSKIVFKFSINGKDNEMKPGVNHEYSISNAEMPIVEFGKPLVADGSANHNAIALDLPLKIRLDLRKVMNEIKAQGYFTTFNGDKIYKDDFKKVYVAGANAPLSWDFDNLHQKPELEMKDPDGDGIYETTLVFNARKDLKDVEGVWKRSRNLSEFPQYTSDAVLNDAIYNMAIEEMINAVEPDSTFRTGKEWAGVWTRDISYSIMLSMAYLQPAVAMKSLLRKVSGKRRIIQDTGTGGAYPVSTDRIVWALAAWEVYKATGDRKWLADSYEIIKNTLDDDFINVFNTQTALAKGESSFLDWREQTYPKWMQPKDIFASYSLGTNALHYQANIVVAKMALLLEKSDVANQHLQIAKNTKGNVNQNGINGNLWMAEKGYYGQYLYGNHQLLSPRSEALGEALCVLFDIADEKQRHSIIEKTPVTAFGIPCIFPQIPDISPYHNDGVWPFVQAFWGLASAKAGNEASVLESMAAIVRPAALFLTNKENFVASTGDFAGTEINSSNMLWSLSGNIAMVHRVLFGIDFEEDKMVFNPFVPQELDGLRRLTNFKYRNAIIDISVEGFGNKIKSFTLDGKVAKPEILAAAAGKHTVKIVLDNTITQSKINKQRNYFSLPTPIVELKDLELSWAKIENAVVYQILESGQVVDQTKGNAYSIKGKALNTARKNFSEWQVLAIDENGVPSFASEIVRVVPTSSVTIYEAESIASKATYNYKGFGGSGFVETSKSVNPKLTFEINVKDSGMYYIDFRYSNGNGPINTDNKCAIRAFQMDGKHSHTFVFPQRGAQEWSNWGYSDIYKVELEAGKHIFSLSAETYTENMNGETNQAMLDCMRMIKID